MHYAEKDKYMKLIKDFLNGSINTEGFSVLFMTIYEGISQKLRQMKKDFKGKFLKFFEFSDFLVKSKTYGIGNSLALVYGDCDSFNPDSSLRTDIQLDEEELRNSVQILLTILQKA